MLDARGNCSILHRSCVTQPFVWRGSTRVLRRSFAGSRGRYILFAWRRGHERRGAMRALRGSRGSHALAAPSDVAQSLCGAGRSTRAPRREAVL